MDANRLIDKVYAKRVIDKVDANRLIVKVDANRLIVKVDANRLILNGYSNIDNIMVVHISHAVCVLVGSLRGP